MVAVAEAAPEQSVLYCICQPVNEAAIITIVQDGRLSLVSWFEKHTGTL
jgi:hypothetical protein